jgi:protein-tyrosine phosphatase
MVDIHHHLLWALDDGSKSLEMSVEMARASAATGVTHVVCTPHANGSWNFDPELNRAKVAELQARLDQEQIDLQIGLGCDFHLSYDNIQDAKSDPARFSINGLGYLLVELPDYGVPRGLNETFYELQLAGLTPILTHPERNPTLQADINRIVDWMRGGLLIQVTADSVTGKMGKTAHKIALDLLEKRWVHFLATDAHNVTSRPPRLNEARDVVARRFGETYAESITLTNPMAVFTGQPFEPYEEPAEIYDNLKEKSWFSRLLSR